MKVWSWRDAIAKTKVSSSAKLVAYTLANYINERAGQAWPSIPTIAEESSLGESTVKRVLKELVEAGLIEKSKRGVAGKEWASNLYRARFPEGVHCGPSAPAMGVRYEPPQAKPPIKGGHNEPPEQTKGVHGDLLGGPQWPTNTPLNYPVDDDDSAGAREPDLDEAKPILHPDFGRVFDAGVRAFPDLRARATSIIHSWLNGGYDAKLDILPAIRQVRENGMRPKSWAYFTPVVEQVKAARTKEVAKALPKPVKRDYSAGMERFGDE